MNRRLNQLRGLTDLVGATFEQGVLAVERFEKDAAKVPFQVLEGIAPVAPVARSVHALVDLSISVSLGAVRAASRTTRGLITGLIDTFNR